MGISDINIKAWFSPNQSVDKKNRHFWGFLEVLAVPEQAIVVCNVYMIHNMKPKAKKISKIPKFNLALIGLKSNKPANVYLSRLVNVVKERPPFVSRPIKPGY